MWEKEGAVFMLEDWIPCFKNNSNYVPMKLTHKILLPCFLSLLHFLSSLIFWFLILLLNWTHTNKSQKYPQNQWKMCKKGKYWNNYIIIIKNTFFQPFIMLPSKKGMITDILLVQRYKRLLDILQEVCVHITKTECLPAGFFSNH